MNNTELTLELMYLEQLAMRRSIKLEDIAYQEMMGDRDIEKSIDPVTLSKISHDNIVTDVEIAEHLRNYPVEVIERHGTRCKSSGVQFCVCTANRIVGTGEPI